MQLGYRHMNTPNGVLKILHVFLGGVSLILVGTSYVSYWVLDIFFITVAVCFGLSLIYLLLYLILDTNFAKSKTNRAISCIYHVLAGVFLIAAGIDLIGWSDYDANCGFKCPRIYEIGVAKILTFINGTLYGIHGFLEAKGADDDSYNENIPLLTSSHIVKNVQDLEPQPHCSRTMYKQTPLVIIN